MLSTLPPQGPAVITPTARYSKAASLLGITDDAPISTATTFSRAGSSRSSAHTSRHHYRHLKSFADKLRSFKSSFSHISFPHSSHPPSSPSSSSSSSTTHRQRPLSSLSGLSTHSQPRRSTATDGSTPFYATPAEIFSPSDAAYAFSRKPHYRPRIYTTTHFCGGPTSPSLLGASAVLEGRTLHACPAGPEGWLEIRNYVTSWLGVKSRLNSLLGGTGGAAGQSRTRPVTPNFSGPEVHTRTRSLGRYPEPVLSSKVIGSRPGTFAGGRSGRFLTPIPSIVVLDDTDLPVELEANVPVELEGDIPIAMGPPAPVEVEKKVEAWSSSLDRCLGSDGPSSLTPATDSRMEDCFVVAIFDGRFAVWQWRAAIEQLLEVYIIKSPPVAAANGSNGRRRHHGAAAAAAVKEFSVVAGNSEAPVCSYELAAVTPQTSTGREKDYDKERGGQRNSSGGGGGGGGGNGSPKKGRDEARGKVESFVRLLEGKVWAMS